MLAAAVWVVAHGQPVLSTARGLLAQGCDCEPPVAFALMLGADVQPLQVTVEQGLILRGEGGHDEANQLVAVVDQAGPCDIGHRVRLGQGPGDGGNEVFLIRPYLQFAGGPYVFGGHLLQS
jgi:hypothetical protein